MVTAMMHQQLDDWELEQIEGTFYGGLCDQISSFLGIFEFYWI
jgi:hypothetical protein